MADENKPSHSRSSGATDPKILLLRNVSADDIEDTYRRGYITTKQRNDLMRDKAKSVITSTLEKDGYFMAVYGAWIKEIQKGWDNFTLEMGNDAKDHSFLRNVGLSIWGQIQMAMSPITAFGQVHGQMAENMALDAGASPGLAKVVGLAADVGTGFLPIGMAARGFAKGVQAVGKAASGINAAKKAEQAASAAKIASAEASAAKAIGEGLIVDGVKPELSKEVFDQLAGRGTEAAAKTAVRAEGPMTATEQFAADLEKFKTEMAGITARKAHDVTFAEAERLGLHIDDLRNLVPGKALNEVEMAAYLKALDPQVEKLMDLASAVSKEPTPESIQALALHASEFFTFAPKFRSAEVTAGRSIEILKETPPMKKLTDLLAGWDPKSVADGDLSGAMQTFAEDLLAISQDADKVKRLGIVQQGGWAEEGEKWWGYARSGYINLLLLRPLTWVKTFGGNLTFSLNHMAERELAGWLSIDKANGVVKGEGVTAFKAMMQSTAEGLGAWSDAYKGLGPAGTRLDQPITKFSGPLGRILNFGGDTLAGIDNFSKVLLTRGEYYAQARRLGMQRGLEGEALEAFIAQRVANPTKAMRDSAVTLGEAGSFQTELGPIGKKAQSVLQAGPMVLLFPFIKSGVNIAKWSLDRTPGLQLLNSQLYRDILEGGVAADMAIGRLTLSNTMAQFYYGLSQAGMLTGSGPTEPSLKRSWLLDHEPYAIRGADGWYPIRNFEPANTPAALVADFAQTINQLDKPTTEQLATTLVISGINDLADKTWFQTVGDIIDAAGTISEGGRVGPQAMKIVRKPLVTVLTGGPLVNSISRAIDPTPREARGLVDEVLARTPGYSETLPPVRDAFGDPVNPPQALGPDWFGVFSPIVMRPNEPDRLKLEAADLQIRVPAFPRSVGGSTRGDFDIRAPLPGDRVPVGLTPEQRDRWQVITRDLLRHPELGIETNLLNRPEYQNLPFAGKREQFRGFMSGARSDAFDMLQLEYPDLFEKITEADAEKVLPTLERNDQERLKSEVKKSVDLFREMAPRERDNLLRSGTIGIGQ